MSSKSKDKTATIANLFELSIGPSKVEAVSPDGNLKAEWYSNDFARSLSSITDVNPGLLPPVTRYVSSDMLTFVIERPPVRKEISFSFLYKSQTALHKESGHYSYHLPIPWSVWLIEFSPDYESILNLKLGFRHTPIYPGDAELQFLPVPNLSSDLTPCLDIQTNSVSKNIMLDPTVPVAGKINHIMSSFWDSYFNVDFGFSYLNGAPFLTSDTVEDLRVREFIRSDTYRSIYPSHGDHDTADMIDYGDRLAYWESLSLSEILELTWDCGVYFSVMPDISQAIASRTSTEVKLNATSFRGRWESFIFSLVS